MRRFERLKFAWLNWRLRHVSTRCGYCLSDLPSLPFERRFCSEDCATQHWVDSAI